MRKRIIAVGVGGVLCLGALVAAQAPPFTVRADRVVREATWGVGGQTPPVPVQDTYLGNVVLTVNGVVVRADRAVIKDGEVALEGNVRLTLPQPK
jgi:hypothetical protein